MSERKITSESSEFAYAQAGVDIFKEGRALKGLLSWVNKTFEFRKDIGLPSSGVGYFANVINLGHNIGLAIATDGVGTKILVAQMVEKYDTIGIDCIAMNVNDILCVGAEPIAMVDYIAVQVPDERLLEDIGKGLYEGAKISQITIPAGETAQIRDMIKGVKPDCGFDLAGTCVGIVPFDNIILGQDVSDGDVVLGLRSSGIHSNGLSLARKIFFKEQKLKPDTYIPDLRQTIGEELLHPTHIYVPEILEVLQQAVDVHALVHITSDGFLNLARIAAPFGFVINDLPEPHPIFSLIQNLGSISDEEMFVVYNMGIGFCIVLPDDDEQISKVMKVCENYGVDCHKLGYAVPDMENKVTIEPKRLIGHNKIFRKY